MADVEPVDVVRHGYDAVSRLYRADGDEPSEYRSWLTTLRRHLPDRADVLDLGCGCGIPISKALSDAGHRVTGVDVSAVQIDRARRLVPDATFVRADATRIAFPDDSFDAVVCLYAIIHMPLPEQPSLIARIAAWLRPGGWLLATTGARAWTGEEENWLGGDATMWWSHADAATYRDWIVHTGLRVAAEEFVPEGDGGHQLFWAHKT
jgi:SAM-dependent methyltransferase